MISLGCVDAGVTEAQCSDYLKEVEGLTRKPLAQVQEGSDRVKIHRLPAPAGGMMTVEEVQQGLKDFGFFPGSQVDGICSYRTQSAIRLFQEHVRSVERLECMARRSVRSQVAGAHAALATRWSAPELGARRRRLGGRHAFGRVRRTWLAWLDAVKAKYVAAPSPVLKLVNDFKRPIDTRKVKDWDFLHKTSVRFVKDTEIRAVQGVSAHREVLLCSGAISTSRLLQLSGAGPAKLLRRNGVAVVHDLAGVGANLRNHDSVRFVASAKNLKTMNELSRAPQLWGQIANWMSGRPNILALSPSLVHYFWYSKEGLTRPDLQGVFSPASYREGYVGMLDSDPGMTCGVWQHRPHSAGTVELGSADPFVDPAIRPNYLADERDREVLVSTTSCACTASRACVSSMPRRCRPFPRPTSARRR